MLNGLNIPCPNGPADGEECWIRQSTDIEVAVSDQGVCNPPSGLDWCEITYMLDGSGPNLVVYEDLDGELTWGHTLSFEEDSLHVLSVTCMDRAGNLLEDIEAFRVDDTPPETTKTYDIPNFAPFGDINNGAPYPHYIDTTTSIVLDAIDPDPTGESCNIGDVTTYYFDTIVPDYQCENEGECQPICKPLPFLPVGTFGEPSVTPCSWETYLAPFTKGEESCHILQFYSVDGIGNIENMNHQCVFVEDKPPIVNKNNGDAIFDFGEPNFITSVNSRGGFHWITSDMPITFTCTDQEPHPSGNEELCFKVSYDYPNWDYVTNDYCDGELENGYCCVDATPNDPFDFYFNENEESMHNLEYFCRDALGHKSDEHIQYYKVDDTAPSLIEKTIDGPRIALQGECPPRPGTDDICHIDGVTTIGVEVEDGGEICAIGVDECRWKYSVYNEFKGWSPYTEWYYTFPINFPEESKHELVIECYDELGNTMDDTEIFYVDKTAPETTFSVTGPQIPDPILESSDYPRYVDTVSRIVLSATDDIGPHDSGVDETYYRVTQVDEQYCESAASGCSAAQGDGVLGGWATYSVPFGIDESCHLIEYYSVDNVDKIEDTEKQCVFSDHTAPLIEKEFVGSQIPNPAIDYPYPHYINSDTMVYIVATDPEPHPSGMNNVKYKVTLVGNDACMSENVCELTEGSGEFIPINGGEVRFPILEDSCHLIEIEAEDNVGKKSAHKQCVFVDNQKPLIEREIIGPKIGDCAQGHIDDCYIDGVTTIEVTVTDPEPHPVNGVTCEWDYDVLGGEKTGTGDSGLTSPFIISFPEESEHLLTIICRDDLGNEVVYDETLLVDKTAPGINKYYGQPRYYSDIANDNLCYKDGDNRWNCYESLAPALSDIGYTELPRGNIMYSTEGPLLEISVQMSGLKANTDYQLTLNGRDGNDGNSELGNNCDNPNGPKAGYVHAWECGTWAGGTGQEGFWNFDMTATSDNEGNYESTYYLEMPDGHYGIGPTHNFGVGFIVKEAADVPGGSNYPPILMEYSGLDWMVGPYSYPMWINSNTPIFGEVTDDGPHKSGVSVVKYRTTRVDDEYCWNDDDNYDCEDAVVDGDWTTVDSNDYDLFEFNIDEDSCHLIEIYAEDNVEKNDLHKQCVFVDNLPPTPVKTVGEPRDIWNGLDAKFYELDDFCLIENNCWKVTMDTPISMSCEDSEPHPVGNERVCFNVELDGDDWTGGVNGYCNEYNGVMNDEGYCCFDRSVGEDFRFLESSEHNLKFYCEDALGNRGPIDDEKFKVDGEGFEIQINKKWNLISVPVVLLNDDPEEVFKNVDVDECIQSVWAYDGVGDEWTVWTPGDAPDNLRVEPGYGYWIVANHDCMLMIGGSLLSPGRTPPSRELVSGWNLVGYYGMDDQEGYYGPNGNGRDAYCAFYSLTGGFFDNPQWSEVSGYWELYNPDTFESYSPGDSLDSGAGYWIFMKDGSDVYSPSSVCWDKNEMLGGILA